MNTTIGKVTGSLAGLLLLAGCATTDEFSQSELAAAESNIKSLVGPQTGAAAPLEAHQADERLSRAREAVGEGDHERARRLATEAEVLALLAAAKADAQRSDAAKAELEQSIRTLQEELNRAQSTQP